MLVKQARTTSGSAPGSSSQSTTQAWHDPIKHPVGITTPARSATRNRGSPTVADTVISSGKNRTCTGMILMS